VQKCGTSILKTEYSFETGRGNFLFQYDLPFVAFGREFTTLDCVM